MYFQETFNTICETQLLSQMIPILLSMLLYNTLPLSVSWTTYCLANEPNMVSDTGCDFQSWMEKRLWILVWLFSPALSWIIYSMWKQIAMLWGRSVGRDQGAILDVGVPGPANPHLMHLGTPSLLNLVLW